MRSERKEARQVLLEGIVDVIIFIGSNLKVLFELPNICCNVKNDI